MKSSKVRSTANKSMDMSATKERPTTAASKAAAPRQSISKAIRPTTATKKTTEADKNNKRVERMSKILSQQDAMNLLKPSDNVSQSTDQKANSSAPKKRASLLYNYQGMSKEGKASEIGVENDRLKNSINIL